MDILLEELMQVGISLLIGSLLGLEREYRCRPAGFRTIALICVGATLFTILSQRMGTADSQDRIAANIVTGIGFIGAGVIFKLGYNVYGLTTAATIWIAAGLGMSVGAGEYTLSWVMLLITLTILAVFETLQAKIDIFYKKRYYTIQFEGSTYDTTIEKQLKYQKIKFVKIKEKRNRNETTCEYEIQGKRKSLDEFNEFLLVDVNVVAFEY